MASSLHPVSSAEKWPAAPHGADEPSTSAASQQQHYVDYRRVASSRTTLFIIDPQRDFHPPNGSLAIATAGDDAARIATMIHSHMDEIDDIVVSLDTHQRFHIAHGLFWVNPQGEHPTPFTMIKKEDVLSGAWRTTDPKWQAWGLEYCTALDEGTRSSLIIWPEHCLVGTNGHAVVDDVNAACQAWAGSRACAVEYVLKGNNALTEHYSAMRADVERPDDLRTHFNTALFERLCKAERVVVCGQALSHCVAFTMRDLVERWPNNQLQKLVLLTDCASPVGGFDDAARTFVEEMTAAGVTVTTSEQLEWSGAGKSAGAAGTGASPAVVISPMPAERPGHHDLPEVLGPETEARAKKPRKTSPTR